jgi:MFS family permease
MTVAAAGRTTGSKGISFLWDRKLDSYPDNGPRIFYLALTVLATIMLYYELYVGGSVSTLFLPKLHMSFTFYVYTVAFSNLIGAFGSLFAGLTDRIGRTNIVAGGLVLTGIFVTFIIPAATNKWAFTIEGWLVGVIEGICLVATPALIRDFSPQVGRGTAMGFWTTGPVVGSLIVAVVASNTIPATVSNSFWTHEYHICGVAGLIVAVIAVLGMRELSPRLRDQLMVSMQDRVLIEAKAKGVDIEESLKNPWGQLLKLDVIASAFGISLFLFVYYTAVGFGLIFFVTVYGFSTKDGNGLGNWNWGFNCIAVILFGFLSDRFRVRKPFMIVGGIAAAIMTVVWLEQIGHHPSYYTLAVIVAILSFTLGIAYVPWMASFTETVEAHNPALTATGLAIWGWILRVVVFALFMILPSFLSSVTPLVDYGSGVQAIVAQYPAFTVPASTLATLQKDPTNAAALAQAHAILGPNYIKDLLAAAKAPKADVAYLQAHAAAVVAAGKQEPGQWKNWYWVCFGAIIVFLGTVPLMKGRWSPKKAREDEEAHEAMVAAEMAKLGISSPATA